MEVPNDYNLIQKLGVFISRERKSWITVPDHINYFDFSSAIELVEHCGFDVLKTDTTFPMYLFLCLGQNFIKDKAAGKRVHTLRVGLELFMKQSGLDRIRRMAYERLSRLHLGRTVIIYGRKRFEPQYMEQFTC